MHVFCRFSNLVKGAHHLRRSTSFTPAAWFRQGRSCNLVQATKVSYAFSPEDLCNNFCSGVGTLVGLLGFVQQLKEDTLALFLLSDPALFPFSSYGATHCPKSQCDPRLFLFQGGAGGSLGLSWGQPEHLIQTVDTGDGGSESEYSSSSGESSADEKRSGLFSRETIDSKFRPGDDRWRSSTMRLSSESAPNAHPCQAHHMLSNF